ncbi:MAG: ABC transporter permease [Haloferacaceae archaeon]
MVSILGQIEARVPSRDAFTLDRIRRDLNPMTMVYLGLFALFLVLIGGPLLFLLFGSFWSAKPYDFAAGHLTLANYIETYLNGGAFMLWTNTIVIATGTTLWANFLGVGMAWIIARTNTPFRRLLEGIVILPYVVPSYLLAVAYIFLLSPQIGAFNKFLVIPLSPYVPFLNGPISIYSFWGIVFVKGISYAPLCFLMTNAAFRNFDPSLEDAARMSGAGVFTTLRTVTLPMLAPSVTASMLLIFTKGLETFSVPAFLGLPSSPPIYVFSTRIWQALSMQSPPNYGLATALATTLIAIAGLGLFIQRRATSVQEKFTTISGQGFNPRRFDLGIWRWGSFSFAMLLLVVSIVMPFLILFIASVSSIWFGKFFFLPGNTVEFTLSNYASLLDMPDFWKAMTNSLLLAGVGAFVGMLFASLTSYFVLKVDKQSSSLIHNTSGFMDQLTYIPAAVPGVVLATGFLWFVLTIPSFGLYGSLWLLGLAYVARELPFGTRTTHGALSQVGDELEEQARVAGAGWLTTIKDIILPVISKNFASGYLLLFMSMMRNLSTSILLYDSDSVVLAVLIFNMKLVGDYEALAALGVVMIAIVLVVMGIVRFGFGASITD